MSDFDDFVKGSTAPASFAHEVIPPQVQAVRDVERRRILQAELDDPELPGGEVAKGFVRKELRRMGKGPKTSAPTTGPNFEDFIAKPPLKTSDPINFAFGEKEIAFINDMVSNLAEGIRGIPGEAAAVSDLVLSLPTQMIGIGAGMGMRARTIGEGKGRTEQATADVAARGAVMEKLGNPIRKIIALVADGEDPLSKTGTDKLMTKFSELLSKGGEWVEERTGGALVKDDVQALVDTAMGAAGGRGLEAGLRKLITPELRGQGVKLSKQAIERMRKENEIPEMPVKPGQKVPYGPFVAPRGQRGAVDVEGFRQRRERGGGLSLAEFEALSPALTLGALIDRSDYTFKTLDRLAQNKTEFSKAHVEQELRRQDVTDAERATVTAALAGVEGSTVTAKDLMVGVKRATGDFELTAKKTDQYATYGLEGIDRVAPDDSYFTRETLGEAEVVEGPRPGTVRMQRPDGEVLEDVRLLPGETPVEALERWRGATVQALEAPPATTTLYRLPDHMPMSEANHFNDAQLFGWTRSFEEGGVRHVVEVQSDLAQHTKGLSPEERAVYQGVYDRASAFEKHTRVLADLEQYSGNRYNAHEVEQYISRLSRLKPEDAHGGSTAGEVRSTIGGLLAKALDPGTPNVWMTAREVARSNPQRVAYAIRQALGEASKLYGLRLQEARVVLEAGERAEGLAPVIKNWPKRLIREELAQAAAAGEKSARFATADTVAKVEGWPDQTVARANGAEGYGADFQGRFRPEHQSIYDRYSRDIEKFLRQLGGKPYTDPQGHTWIEVPIAKRGPVQMFGAADTDLLKPLAGATVGAALGLWLDREPGDTGIGGAVLGGLAGGAMGARGTRTARREAIAGLDRGLGLISTRMGNISQPILHRAREFERRILGDAHARIQRADPFLVGLEKLKSPELELAIKTNDQAKIDALMPPELRGEWAKTRALLDEVGLELQTRGRLKNLREDYFPRVVKDTEGLLDALGKTERTLLEAKLLRATAAAVKAGQGSLSQAEASAIINEHLQQRVGGDRPGFAKQRRIAEVTAQLDPFYASNTEALHSYLTSATQAIERARFFGRDLVTKVEDGRTIVDLNSSIGRVVQRELESKKITPRQADELAEILRARFESKQTSGPIQDFKNLANLGLLGNVISAGTQLGDIGTAVYMEGLRPSLEALARSLSRQNRVSMKDFGLVDHLSEEFVSTRGTAKVLNQAFKLSGFAAVDALGKNVLLNAALSKYQRLAQTAKGQAQIARKYKDAWADDYPALVAELKSGVVGEQTRGLLFHELSDAQPISKLEVPQKYLELPNGRVLYMLKTFMLKQADIVRRDAYNEFKAGNKQKALGNLAKYAIALGVSGAATQVVKDWLLGRPIDFDSETIALNMVKTFGFSEYVLDKFKQGKPVEAALGVATPPFKMMDDIIRDNSSAVRYIPLFGPLIYAHEFGGADKAQAKAGAKAAKENQPLTPEQRAAIARIRQERRRKRLEEPRP